MTSTFDSERFLKFYRLGELAFENGEPRVPAFNSSVMAELESSNADIGNSHSYEVFHAFLKGWTEASLRSNEPYAASGF